MTDTSKSRTVSSAQVVEKAQPALKETANEHQSAPATPPVMRPDYLKRVIYIMIPVSIIAFLIISISLTFGQTDAGEAMGVLEGCLIIIAGLLVVFFPPIRAFFKRTFGKAMSNRKNKK